MSIFRKVAPEPPRFPGAPRTAPRVVVENFDYAERYMELEILRVSGFEVVGCGGPDELFVRGCPLLVGNDCFAITDADLVISSLRLEDPADEQIIRSIRERYPRTPLIVEAPPAVVERFTDVLEGCHTLYPLTAEGLLAAAIAAVGNQETF